MSNRTRLAALAAWISEWVETLRVAPPFSSRRRELLAAIAEADEDLGDPRAWSEVTRPGGRA